LKKKSKSFENAKEEPVVPEKKSEQLPFS